MLGDSYIKCSQEKTPEASKIFVSALSATSVTISGPPARLKGLFRTADFFRDRKHIQLPVFGGLCHAKHIYTQENVHRVVRTPSMELLNARVTPHIPVFSTSSGRPFPATTATELFENIISEILMQPIQWDRNAQNKKQRTKDIGATQCQVITCRISLPIHDLSAALKKVKGIEESTLELIPWIHEKSTIEGGPRGTM